MTTYNSGTGLSANTPEYENIMYVDQNNMRIGILNPNPAYPLDVNGVINCTTIKAVNGSITYISASNVVCSNITTIVHSASNLTASNITGFNGGYSNLTASNMNGYNGTYSNLTSSNMNGINGTYSNLVASNLTSITSISASNAVTACNLASTYRITLSNNLTSTATSSFALNSGPSNYIKILPHTGNGFYNNNCIDGDTLFLYQNSASSNGVIIANNINTNNSLKICGNGIAINKNNPSYPLDVAGDVNISGLFRINGSAISTSAMPSNITCYSVTASSNIVATNSNVVHKLGNLTLNSNVSTVSYNDILLAQKRIMYYFSDPLATGIAPSPQTIVDSDGFIPWGSLKNVPDIPSTNAAATGATLGSGLLAMVFGGGAIAYVMKNGAGQTVTQNIVQQRPYSGDPTAYQQLSGGPGWSTILGNFFRGNNGNGAISGGNSRGAVGYTNNPTFVPTTVGAR